MKASTDLPEPPLPTAPACYSIDDIAELLKCSTRTAWRLIDAGKIPGRLRLSGRLVRFSKTAVDRWLQGETK